MWIGEVGFCLGLGRGVAVGGRGVAVGGVVRWCMGRRLGSYQWEFLCKDFIAFNPRINPQTY